MYKSQGSGKWGARCLQFIARFPFFIYSIAIYKMRSILNKLLLVFISILPSLVFAANRDTANTYVKQISVWGHSGGVLIQMNPRPNIEGLGCTDDYWLRLNKSDEGYETMLSMLIAAQVTNKPILVRAEDDGDSTQPYCRLQRIISYQ